MSRSRQPARRGRFGHRGGQPLLSCLCTLLLSAAALADASPETGPGQHWRALQGPSPFAATGEGDLHALDGGRWLVSDGLGLYLTDGVTNTQVMAGVFESIDAREDVEFMGTPHVLVSMIDANAGQFVLAMIDARTGRIAAKRILDAPDALPEVQCLYRHGPRGDISLFSVDARGFLEQRYVYHAERQVLVHRPVRRDVGLLEAEGCAVHDGSGSLYIAEGPLGVWRYAASEETDALREAMLLAAPWGGIEGELEDLAVDESGTLWALDTESERVYRRSPDGVVSSIPAPAFDDGAAIAARASDSAVSLALFDQTRGAMRFTELRATGPVAAPDAAPLRPAIAASAETAPVRRYGDAADDPAIHVPENAGEPVLILGTDKRAGLAVYGLSGDLLQMLSVGRLNNVDILSGVMVRGRPRTIAAASNRSHNSISLFSIEDGTVTHLADVATTLSEVYGLCTYASSSGAYVFINDTDGRFQQYRLEWRDGVPSGVRVRQFRLPSQPEGCVADATTGRLYMGEEAAGVWEAGAEPDGDAPRLVIETGEALVADVEGMGIYHDGAGAGGSARSLLVVSSQGSDSYAVYELHGDYRLLAAFRIVADLGAGIDGVSETDGLAVTSTALPGYPRGVLVVQDGRNRMPDAPQNFKIVDWRRIDALLGSRPLP